MVVLVVAAGHEPPHLAQVLTAVEGIGPDPLVQTTGDRLARVLSEDLLASLAMAVVVSGPEAEAGHRACQALRSVTSVPLGLVCASTREVDELMAFANGCDDFIPVTCSPAVLQARLGALLARGRRSAERVIVFGCLKLDPRLRTATVRGEPVPLTRTEFDLATALVANQRRVVSRHELLEQVWGGCQTHEHVIDVHLSRLRAKVLAAGGPKLGEPVPSVGYRVGHPTCPPGDCRPFGAA